MAKTIQRAAEKVTIIDNNNNQVIAVKWLQPISSQGFDNYRYNGRLYAAFKNIDKDQNLIYVDTTPNELETEENA